MNVNTFAFIELFALHDWDISIAFAGVSYVSVVDFTRYTFT